MKQRASNRPGYGRILEAWRPPEDAGEPLGCVATTFTFGPAFFEEECLSRFLALETAPEDGAAYLIEREEKLAQAAAAVLVDQHHARGKRNPRWDLLAARVPGGILHAKVSLLLWTHHARLIVASANLTEPGYRRNHEVFAVLDFFPGSHAPLPVLVEMVEFLRRAVSFAASDKTTPSPALNRWNSFLDLVLKRSRQWGARQPPRSLARLRVFAVTTIPGGPNAFRRLREIWPAGAAPSEAFIVSPFFDPPDVRNKPAEEVWRLLRRRGKALVQFEVIGEDAPGGGVLLHAPESLRKAQPADRDSAETVFRRLKLETDRALHAKCLRLQNGEWAIYLMGSSNFTAAGLGLSKLPNVEANLAYAVCHARNGKACRALQQAWLDSEEGKGNPRFLREPLDDREDAPLAGDILLPAAFGEAVVGKEDQGALFVELTFPSPPPAGWRLLLEDKDEVFFNELAWRARRSPARMRLPWRLDRPPSAFRVSWRGSKGFAWWPVNVRDAAALPPPDELRSLSLDDLIEILGSARPLHQVLRRWLRNRSPGNPDGQPPHLDPHRRVDTSGFLLQRTRRLSWALAALRERLAQPVPSRAALHWRLRGPCGVMALARAILGEDRIETEKAFQLAEIAVELALVEPRYAPGCLPRPQVRAALRECVREIRALVPAAALGDLPQMKSYIKRAFREASA
jgi:hypothetical protein